MIGHLLRILAASQSGHRSLPENGQIEVAFRKSDMQVFTASPIYRAASLWGADVIEVLHPLVEPRIVVSKMLFGNTSIKTIRAPLRLCQASGTDETSLNKQKAQLLSLQRCGR